MIATLEEGTAAHAAREQQGFIEGRLADIEGKLSNAHVIDVAQLTHLFLDAENSAEPFWSKRGRSIPLSQPGAVYHNYPG